jgi:hypothetical protein
MFIGVLSVPDDFFDLFDPGVRDPTLSKFAEPRIIKARCPTKRWPTPSALLQKFLGVIN